MQMDNLRSRIDGYCSAAPRCQVSSPVRMRSSGDTPVWYHCVFTETSLVNSLRTLNRRPSIRAAMFASASQSATHIYILLTLTCVFCRHPSLHLDRSVCTSEYILWIIIEWKVLNKMLQNLCLCAHYNIHLIL